MQKSKKQHQTPGNMQCFSKKKLCLDLRECWSFLLCITAVKRRSFMLCITAVKSRSFMLCFTVVKCRSFLLCIAVVLKCWPCFNMRAGSAASGFTRVLVFCCRLCTLGWVCVTCVSTTVDHARHLTTHCIFYLSPRQTHRPAMKADIQQNALYNQPRQRV